MCELLIRHTTYSKPFLQKKCEGFVAWVLPKINQMLNILRLKQSRRHIYLQASYTGTFSYLSSSSFGDNSQTNSQLSTDTGLQICCIMSQTTINGTKGQTTWCRELLVDGRCLLAVAPNEGHPRSHRSGQTSCHPQKPHIGLR